ncbi:MAG: mandelate racemase/muconate lactonizing enzyme family protein [Halobacteriaceae archaeon]
MHITDVTVHALSLPETRAIADGTQDATVVEIETSDGITGIGEAADSPPSVVRSVFDAPVSHRTAMGLKHVLTGRDPLAVESLWTEMFERIGLTEGRSGTALSAISAADIALWDIRGKAFGEPIYRLLGGGDPDPVDVYASTLFPEDATDVAAVRTESERLLEAGFSGVKFGWGGFGDGRETDRALVEAARDALGRDVDLMVDAGLCWRSDVKRARREINELDAEFDLYFVEEPLYPDNYDGYAELSRACETRIVAGEREATHYGFAELVSKGGLDAVQPDVARAGGITQLCKIQTLADVAGVPLIPHGYSTDVLVAASLHVLAARVSDPLLEYVVEESPIREGVTEETVEVTDGRVAVPEAPGLGVTLNRDVVEEYRTDP